MTYQVVGVLPTLGRLNETIALIPRLLETSGIPFELCVVVDGDQREYTQIQRAINIQQYPYRLFLNTEPLGYWGLMSRVAQMSEAPYILNLANDILPGRTWLKRAMVSYEEQLGNKPGFLGLNDGVHDKGGHCGHFIIARELLQAWYGDILFPTCYFHLYGDTEIADRAREADVYKVEPWSVLYHNHPANGNQTDGVYRIAHQHHNDDMKMYQLRKAASWPPLPTS